MSSFSQAESPRKSWHYPSIVQLSVGCVRSRFAKHIAVLILVDAAASAVGYYLTGYAFAWGDNVAEDGAANGNYFIGACPTQTGCTENI